MAITNSQSLFTGSDATNPSALDDVSNWSPTGVPTVTNDAVITAGGDTALASGGTLRFNGSTATAQNFGSLNVDTSSSIIINNVLAGSTVTLTLGGASSLGNSYAPATTDALYVGAGSTLALNGSSGGAGTLNLAIAAGDTFDVAGTMTLGANLSGGSALIKTGAGTLTLAPTVVTNGYSGGTTINGGVVQIATTYNLGTQGATINGGALRFTGNLSGGTSRTFTIGASNSAIDVTSGAGTVLLTSSTGLTGSGILNVNGTAAANDTGTLETYGTNVGLTGGTINIVQGQFGIGYNTSSGIAYEGTSTTTINVGTSTTAAQLFFFNFLSGVINNPVVLANAGSNIYDGTSGTNVFSWQMSGGISGPGTLNKTGGGTLILTAANSFTGGVNVSGGILDFTTTSAIPVGNTITLGAGTTLLYANATNGVSLNRAIVLNGSGFSALNVSSASVTDTYAGSITGTGGLSKVGGYGLYLTNAANTYSGGTNISTGTLRSNVAGGTGTGLVNVLSGATLGGNGSVGPVTVSGTITAGSSGTSIGSLTTGLLTFNTANAAIKIDATTALPTAGTPGDSGTAGTTNDLLVVTSLNTSSGTTTVTPSVLNGGLTLGSSYSFAIGEIPAANLSTSVTTFSSLVSSLAIGNSFYYANASFQDVPHGDAAGDDLLVLNFTAAPEPTSLLMLGVAAAPLIIGRRRRIRA